MTLKNAFALAAEMLKRKETLHMVLCGMVCFMLHCITGMTWLVLCNDVAWYDVIR